MRTGLVVAVGTILAGLTACDAYRIEYHTRPSYMMNAAGLEENERITLDDGTVVVFSTRDSSPDMQQAPGGTGQRFQIREELDDGTVVLRNMLPQHVLANTLQCLRNEEYELIWEQLLSDRTKREYELRGQGEEDFARFFAANRLELAATLTRMLLGLARSESFMKSVGGGVMRFHFHPRIAPQFRFKTVEVIAEGGSLKLLLIK